MALACVEELLAVVRAEVEDVVVTMVAAVRVMLMPQHTLQMRDLRQQQ